MRVTRYSDSAAELDTLKDTDIYKACAQAWQGVRPRDWKYIRGLIARGTTGVLLRGWLFDFSPLLNADRGAQMNLF